jgi:ABC-type transport system involved in cytochrome bd biosynthesis fused ATPase/permease subunit
MGQGAALSAVADPDDAIAGVLAGDHPENKGVALRLMDLTTRNAQVLTKLFGGQGTINVSSWSRVAIIGRSGTGKSTLLKILSGDLQPDAGSIWRAPGSEE